MIYLPISKNNIKEEAAHSFVNPSVEVETNDSDHLIDRLSGFGNMKAYKDFSSTKSHVGSHVHVDLNNFGKVNRVHGHEIGDEGIKTFSKIADSLVKYYKGKSFRVRGDDFRFHFQHPQSAHLFARDLKRQLDEFNSKHGGLSDGIDESKDPHHLSASIGIGNSALDAAHYMSKAKSTLGTYETVTDPGTGATVSSKTRKDFHPEGRAPNTIASFDSSKDVPSSYHPAVSAKTIAP